MDTPPHLAGSMFSAPVLVPLAHEYDPVFALGMRKQWSTKERRNRDKELQIQGKEGRGEETLSKGPNSNSKVNVEGQQDGSRKGKSWAAIAPPTPVEKDGDLKKDGPHKETQDHHHSPARWLSLPGLWEQGRLRSPTARCILLGTMGCIQAIWFNPFPELLRCPTTAILPWNPVGATETRRARDVAKRKVLDAEAHLCPWWWAVQKVFKFERVQPAVDNLAKSYFMNR